MLRRPWRVSRAGIALLLARGEVEEVPAPGWKLDVEPVTQVVAAPEEYRVVRRVLEPPVLSAEVVPRRRDEAGGGVSPRLTTTSQRDSPSQVHATSVRQPSSAGQPRVSASRHDP